MPIGRCSFGNLKWQFSIRLAHGIAALQAVARYYLNNFQDGVKQDAIDLLTGESV
jgi:hypothetical protein